MRYPHLFARVYNVPLLLHPDKAKVIEEVFRAHLQAPPVRLDEDGPSAEERAEAEHERRCRTYAGIDIVRADDKPYTMTRAGVAIVPVLGTLVQRGSWLDAMSGLTSYDSVASMLELAIGDHDVRAIMMEIDSPGGEAYGLADLADRVFAARQKKPLWAHANEQAYSAAYWLASSAARLSTPITGGVGSIGAVMMHVDQSKRDNMMGMKYTFIHSGARKVDGNRHEPLSKPALTWAQEEVDRHRSLFAQAVATRRGLSTDAVMGTEAALLTPAQALDGGYIDGVETLLQAVSLLEREMWNPGSTGARTVASRTSKETSMRAKQEGAAAEQQAADAKHTDAQLEAARAEARADGEKAGKEAGRKEGVSAERARVGAIIECEEAKGRGALALHLALHTDTDVEAAKKLLAAAPKETGSSFHQAMSQLQNPKVGADAPPKEQGGQPKIDRQSIYAARQQAPAAVK